MTESLVEKVARLAKWQYYEPTGDWFIDESAGTPAANKEDGAVYPDGIVFLLDELLRAEFVVAYQNSVFSDKEETRPSYTITLTRNRTGSYRQLLCYAGDTLEEAVMLAYVAMKEGV